MAEDLAYLSFPRSSALSLVPVSFICTVAPCWVVRSCLVLLPFPPCFFPVCITCFFVNVKDGVEPERVTGYVYSLTGEVLLCLGSVYPFILATSVQVLLGVKPSLKALNVLSHLTLSTALIGSNSCVCCTGKETQVSWEKEWRISKNMEPVSLYSCLSCLLYYFNYLVLRSIYVSTDNSATLSV